MLSPVPAAVYGSRVRPWARTAIEALVLVTLASIAAGVALSMAQPLVEAAAAAAHAERLHVTSPSDPYAAFFWIAVSFATPPLVALLPLLGFAAGARRPPPPWLAPLALAALAVVFGLGLAFQWLTYAAMAEWMGELGPDGGIEPSVGLVELDVGGVGRRWSFYASLLLTALAFGLARRSRLSAA
jgi:hypothetical protein